MIGIVGGGISGLLLGRELQARGIPFQIFEAGPAPGGVIRSGRVEGHLLDWGPQRARLTDPMAALVSDLGLDDQVVTAESGLDLMVYRDGRLRKVPFSVPEFLTSDIAGFRSKLGMLREPFTSGPIPDESVADYFRRKLGDELYRGLVGPLYGGLYASDPAHMDMESSLGRVLRKFGIGRSLVLSLLRKGGTIDPPPACTFREGMQALPRALAASLGERVFLDTPVHAMRPRGPHWVLETSRGTFDARQVVLTVPAPRAAELLAGSAPRAADRIQGLTYNPLAVVHLHSEADLGGMGFQVAFGEGLALKGTTFNHALFGRTHVYTAYLGGAQRPHVVDYDDERLGALAAREFRLTTGADDARPLSVAREYMPAWDRSWNALAGMELPSGVHLVTNWESRPGLPGRMARASAMAVQLDVPDHRRVGPRAAVA